MTTLLVDGNNLAMTAIYGMKRTSLMAQGVQTGPFVAAVGRLRSYVRDVAPDRLLVAWDGGRSARRLELDPGYKMGRTQQPPPGAADTFLLLDQFFTLAGVPQLRVDGEEADDLIAGAWAHLRFQDESERIVVLSSDKDLLQLVGQNPYRIETVQIRFNTANGDSSTDASMWTRDRLIQDKGVQPEHLGMLMALTGDQVDGIAGVPGVGPVKGLKLLRESEFDLGRVVERVRESHGDEAADRIAVDFALVDLRSPTCAPAVPRWRPTSPVDEERHDSRIPVLRQFLRHYQLTQIEDWWSAGTLWKPRLTLGTSWGKSSSSSHG